MSLSIEKVQSYFSGRHPLSKDDCKIFMGTCKFLRLNPFICEIYLIKYYPNKPAQIVIAKDGYIIHVRRDNDYNGHEQGIVVYSKAADKVQDIVGCIVPPGDWELIGGWAKVYIKNVSVPVTKRVSLAEYKRDNNWKTMPATMIAKVALSQAIREAFPANLIGTIDNSEEPTVEANTATTQSSSLKDLKAASKRLELLKNMAGLEEMQKSIHALDEAITQAVVEGDEAKASGLLRDSVAIEAGCRDLLENKKPSGPSFDEAAENTNDKNIIDMRTVPTNA